MRYDEVRRALESGRALVWRNYRIITNISALLVLIRFSFPLGPDLAQSMGPEMVQD
jgi:hypothetical protein